ncbi:conjugal transfer protein TraF [Thioalkalivibrio thiocyanodenitrificans]|uniref:conjugal transfer protein TraF n=1 Tax=Thioalkalivibrio thiocyanodenitrificans TaxID=243063 RepID=UPI000365CF87|nr:conjugal transfer protein TraF [Thioalkalivibrio thiocyanodenitrificans]
MKSFTLPIILIGLFVALGAGANERVERGWWFYEAPPETEEEEIWTIPPPSAAKPAEPDQGPEDPCLDKDTWTVSCGFVNPGNDFSFQERQRDELLNHMVMNPQDRKAVEAFQYYTKWMMDQATAVASMWTFNRVQNPELDPRVTYPVTNFGLRILHDIRESNSGDIFDFLSENGYLVYFSRTDCVYCHNMRPVLEMVAERTGLSIWNASLDEDCMPGFEQLCMVAPATLDPASVLEVSIVPSIFLYVEPDTWIRVGNGIVTYDVLESRIVNFFSAYRAAMIKGIEPEDGQVPVDFSTQGGTGARGLGRGLEPGPGSTSGIETMLRQAR